MRIGFAGTPEFSAHILKHLVAQGVEIALVITGEDKKIGRGKVLTPNPVKTFADKTGLTTYQPVTLKTPKAVEYIQSYQLDVLIVVAYGQILTTEVLTIPTYGCLNIHTSLLPRWRGAAPIQRAIEAGDTVTGVSIMQMDEGLDTGDVLYTKTCDIAPTETTLTLYEKLITLSQEAISHTLTHLTTLTPIPQQGEAIYAPKLTKAEGKINWDEDASAIYNKIRAFNLYPIAHTTINDGKVLRIIEAELLDTELTEISQTKTKCIIPAKSGSISLKKVQLEGKKAVDIQDFNNGVRLLNII